MNGPVSVIVYVRWDSGIRLGTTSSERAIPRHSEIQTSVLSVFRVKYLYHYLCTICRLALIASKGCRHSAEIMSETPLPDRCPPFSTKRSRRNQPDFSSRSRATADILIAYESPLGWLFAPTGVACGVESGAGTSGLRAPGAPIPLHRQLHSTNFSREVAAPILQSAEAQNGPSFDFDAALGPTSTQPYTAAGCRSRTGMTVTVTRHDDRLSRQIRGTRHDVSSYTGGMATAVPI